VNASGKLDQGTLELYVLGALPPEEMARVEHAIGAEPEVHAEFLDIQLALEAHAWLHSVPPPEGLRTRVLDKVRRIAQGDAPMCTIDDHTRTSDLPAWIFDLPDPAAEEYENMHLHYLDRDPEMESALVWVKHHVPEEVHVDIQEAFHLLEGTCEVLIGDQVRRMGPGDSISIPLHVPHSIRVTSAFPCKVIAQRRPIATA
jgi:mannose-6-phosphate isomerase-like protein (cupin superfamily)